MRQINFSQTRINIGQNSRGANFSKSIPGEIQLIILPQFNSICQSQSNRITNFINSRKKLNKHTYVDLNLLCVFCLEIKPFKLGVSLSWLILLRQEMDGEWEALGDCVILSSFLYLLQNVRCALLPTNAGVEIKSSLESL